MPWSPPARMKSLGPGLDVVPVRRCATASTGQAVAVAAQVVGQPPTGPPSQPLSLGVGDAQSRRRCAWPSSSSAPGRSPRRGPGRRRRPTPGPWPRAPSAPARRRARPRCSPCRARAPPRGRPPARRGTRRGWAGRRWRRSRLRRRRRRRGGPGRRRGCSRAATAPRCRVRGRRSASPTRSASGRPLRERSRRIACCSPTSRSRAASLSQAPVLGCAQPARGQVVERLDDARLVDGVRRLVPHAWTLRRICADPVPDSPTAERVPERVRRARPRGPALGRLCAERVPPARWVAAWPLRTRCWCRAQAINPSRSAAPSRHERPGEQPHQLVASGGVLHHVQQRDDVLDLGRQQQAAEADDLVGDAPCSPGRR